MGKSSENIISDYDFRQLNEHIIGAEPELLLPFLTKYLAGSTALVAVMHDLNVQGQLNLALVNPTSAGFLLHPPDLPGVAILLSAGKRLGKTALPAISGALIGIALRTLQYPPKGKYDGSRLALRRP